MPSTISAGTTAGTAIAVAGDTSGVLQLQTNGTTTAMTIDTSQNVGIGTSSPQSWATYAALEINKGSGGYVVNNASGGFTAFGQNLYFNSGYKYANSAPASLYYQQGGAHVWQTASSGTAGNAITLTDRMIIDSSGRVTTPSQPGFRAGLQSSTPSIAAGGVWRFDTASGNGRFNTGGHYNASTYTFTAPVAGQYYFHMQIITEGNGNNTSRTDMIVLQLNGGVVAYSERRGYYVANTTGDNGFYVDNVTAILQLSAGDNVRGANNSPSAATQHANGVYSIFEGYLLG